MALRLVYWIADGDRGRKIELDQFLSEYGVDICFLKETRLESDQAVRFAKYLCHRAELQGRGVGTMILVRGSPITTRCQSGVCSTWKRPPHT